MHRLRPVSGDRSSQKTKQASQAARQNNLSPFLERKHTMHKAISFKIYADGKLVKKTRNARVVDARRTALRRDGAVVKVTMYNKWSKTEEAYM